MKSSINFRALRNRYFRSVYIDAFKISYIEARIELDYVELAVLTTRISCLYFNLFMNLKFILLSSKHAAVHAVVEDIPVQDIVGLTPCLFDNNSTLVLIVC